MPVRVETETVQKADLLDTFTVSATVTPKDSQYVCAPLSGTVSEVAAKEGETVEPVSYTHLGRQIYYGFSRKNHTRGCKKIACCRKGRFYSFKFHELW